MAVALVQDRRRPEQLANTSTLHTRSRPFSIFLFLTIHDLASRRNEMNLPNVKTFLITTLLALTVTALRRTTRLTR